MANAGNQGGNSGSSLLGKMIRTLTPWYAGAVALYAPVQTLYSWLHGSGVVPLEWYQAIYVTCHWIGIFSFFAAIGGMTAIWVAFPVMAVIRLLLSFMGNEIAESQTDRAVWRFTVGISTSFGLGAIWLFGGEFMRDLSNEPNYPASEDIYIWIGAAVLLAAYIFSGRLVYLLVQASKE